MFIIVILAKYLGRRSLLWKMLSFDELPNSFDLLSIYSYSFSKARCVLSYLKYANFINKKRIKTANKWRAISLNNTCVMWIKSRHLGSIFHSAFQIINNMYLSYQKNINWYFQIKSDMSETQTRLQPNTDEIWQMTEWTLFIWLICFIENSMKHAIYNYPRHSIFL